MGFIFLLAVVLKANKLNIHITVICINNIMNYSLTIHYVACKKCCLFEVNQTENQFKLKQQESSPRTKNKSLTRHY